MSVKEFHVADLISVTADKMLGPNGVDGLYALLQHMCGEEVYTHQVPRLLKQCAPYLLKKYPALASVQTEGVTEANHQEWLAIVVKQFGETLAVESLPPGEHYSIDPVSEAAEKFHPSHISLVKNSHG